MKTYSLKFEQHIDLPVDDVFNFFSKPENLSLITPARLKFDILTPTPLTMKEGQLVDYSLRIMYIIKLHLHCAKRFFCIKTCKLTKNNQINISLVQCQLYMYAN